MNIDIENTASSIGLQIKRIRLRKNMTQRELSVKSKVSLNTIKRIENGNPTSFYSVIKVLLSLDKIEWFNSLSPIVSISPLYILKHGHDRLRAYKKNN